MAFKDSPLGTTWIYTVIEAINYTQLSHDRWDKLKASGYDAPLVPNEIERAIQSAIALVPGWISDPLGLAPYFFVQSEPSVQELGRTVLNELNELKIQLEALPDIYFEPPYTPPEPNPDNTDCQNLIEAINGIRAGATGASSEQIRQIVREELSPVVMRIVQAEANVRHEMLEIRNETEFIFNALRTPDSPRESPVPIIDKYFEFWSFPIQNVPSSFIKKKDKEGNITPIQYRSINSYLELIQWQVKIFEELIGQFPIDIDIVINQEEVPVLNENGEPVTDENGKLVTETEINKQLLSFPNVAETLADFFPLIYQSWKNSEKCEELLAKANIEICQLKKMAVQTSAKLQALEDYLGYPLEEDIKEVPFSISINQKTIQALSKPSKQSIDIVKYTAETNFLQVLERFNRGVAIIESVYWRPLPKDAAGAAARFKEIIENEKEIQDEIDKKNIDDVDSRIEEIETGLITKSGISNSLPYGEKFENRPRITQIGNTAELED